MSEQWMQFLGSQWWLFALLGAAAVLAFVIRGKSDEEALKLLSNKLWGAGAAFVAWYALQASTSNPYWGLGIGAGIVFAVLTFIPLGYQRLIVSSENWGRFLTVVVGIGVFITLIMPTMTPSQISNLVIGALFIGVIYIWSDRKKLGAMIRAEKQEDQQKDDKKDKDDVVEASVVEEETPPATPKPKSSKKS